MRITDVNYRSRLESLGVKDHIAILMWFFFFYFIFQKAVDVVGQAGKPKTITGFQTHTTPVLLAYGERAELATEECILYTFYN